ncbi:hypothetical protein NEOLEDRAFT_1117111 [Neolentinus lepideus HHB14362 ss-1]|uniref:DNA-directed DNA polymerase n=1 Tax=Neolentinus lepideus HHB14362 ss-1 TaxID=1314782 RepID=A0A165RQI9_9AGAM|nr:hypothetical protein NEOLEDRAFT_1117111 [Neolentinus lepideus HHB14362 ss-1]
MSTTLPLFWHLSSNNKKERIDASVKLIGALEQFQAQFIPKASPETTEDEEENSEKEEDALDTLNAQDVSYSIRRLIRGLASPRESSRLGFAVALTELLSRISTVTCSQIVSLIMDCSKTQGSMTGQEERDMLFARLFGLTSIIQSGLIVRDTPLLTSASFSTIASSLASYQEVMKQLIELGEKKSWLRESAWWTLGLTFDTLVRSSVLWKDDAIEATFDMIYEEKSWSPEKVAITVTLQDQYPQKDWRKHLSPTFKNPRILNTANLATLAKILQESASDEDGETGLKAAAAGAWKPQVHYVWDIILDALLPAEASTKQPQGSLQEFFRIVVDDSLFAATSSAERKYWGFQVFGKALRHVDASDMPMLFTKNFMRCWINHLSKQDRYLHKVAKQVATEMQSIVQKNPTMGFTLILQLTGVHGNRQFDKLTRTKTVESILTSMDADGIKNYIDYLLGQVNEEVTETTDVQAVNSRRLWIVDQLSALIRNGTVPKQDEWISTVLEWLTIHGLFEIKKTSEKSSYLALRCIPTPPLSDELRESCRAKLLSCLADLLTSFPTKKSGKTGQTITLCSDAETSFSDVSKLVNDGQSWIARTLDVVSDLEKNKKHASLLAGLDEDHQHLRSRANGIVSPLDNASEEQGDLIQGAKALIQATLIYQLCNAGEEDGPRAEALESCLEAASRLLESRKKGKKRRKSEAAEELPLPVDVFVDTIIGFLEEPSSYMRAVANHSFTRLSHCVQESTIDLILAQLERRNPSELLEDNDEAMSADGEDALDDEDSAKDDGSSAEDESDEKGSEVEEPDLELRKEVEAALEASGVKPTAEDSEEDSEEETMDDDQMMALDEQLAAVFKTRTVEAKKGKDVNAQREATHFKNRVLDLVDILVKTNPGSSFITRFIMPLLELMSGCSKDEEHLSRKAGGLLRSRIGKLKEVPSEVEVEQASKLLGDLHTQARRVRSAEILASFSQCSVYLSRLLLHSGAEIPVLTAYRESLKDFVSRKSSSLNAQFFQDFIRYFPSSAWQLRNAMLEVIEKAVNTYRQYQTYMLLQGLLTRLPDLETRYQEVIEFMPSLRQNLYKVLGDAGGSTSTLSSVQMKDVFKLALTAVRQTERLIRSSDSIAKIWDPCCWENLLTKLQTSERFKSSIGLHALCTQMSRAAAGCTGFAAGASAKRKASAAENDGDPGEEGAPPLKAKRVKTKRTKS